MEKQSAQTVVKIIGIVEIIASVALFLISIIVILLGGLVSLVGSLGSILSIFAGFIGYILLILSILLFIATLKLMKHINWGRITVAIIALVGCLCFIGGIYSAKSGLNTTNIPLILINGLIGYFLLFDKSIIELFNDAPTV